MRETSLVPRQLTRAYATTYATKEQPRIISFALLRTMATGINPDWLVNMPIAGLLDRTARTCWQITMAQASSTYEKPRGYVVREPVPDSAVNLRPGDLEGLEDVRAGHIRSAASFEEFARRVTDPWDD